MWSLTPARHRTIAAALEWSYQLLSERERYVFRCLGIFAGSFTLEVVATTDTHRRITAKRRYRTCSVRKHHRSHRRRDPDHDGDTDRRGDP